MEICGDFIELNERNEEQKTQETIELENIKWQFKEDAKIPSEIFSLYSIQNGQIIINDVSNEILQGIKKSKYSRVSGHIHKYEELFIVFFEFAIEIGNNEFDVIHFGIVPTQDFFSTLETNNIIRIRDIHFNLTKYRIEKILSKFKEYESN